MNFVFIAASTTAAILERASAFASTVAAVVDHAAVFMRTLVETPACNQPQMSEVVAQLVDIFPRHLYVLAAIRTAGHAGIAAGRITGEIIWQS